MQQRETREGCGPQDGLFRGEAGSLNKLTAYSRLILAGLHAAQSLWAL
jgi:hypothetical protein